MRQQESKKWIAMTVRYSFAFSPRDAPEFCLKVPPSSFGGSRLPQEGSNATPRGEQGMPDARRVRSACAKVESTRVSHHGHTGITRHSPRDGFNSLLRALPGDRACLPPSSTEILQPT